MKYLILYLVLINCLSFGLMAADKARAVRGKWRIRERTLFLAAAAGGSLGGLLAMFFFRHKTLHSLFRVGFPLLLALHAALLFALWFFVARA